MIYLPWFPNGDPYSPPTPLVYHRYYGDYYQTYDLYMTSLTKLGNVLSRAISSPIASLLGESHIFVDAYVPYSISSASNTPWINNLYEFMKGWAVLDEKVLEIYLFGGSHDYGYFEGNQWIWVSRPEQIPPDKKRFPGILEDGEYLYSFDVEFPIQLVPNTGIHYLTPYGNEIHWVFERIGKDGLWKPKYPVLEGGVVYKHGGLPIQLEQVTLPDPRVLGDELFESLRKVEFAYTKTVEKTYIPGYFQGLRETSCDYKYFPRYDLLDDIQCNPELYDSMYRSYIGLIQTKSQEEGITFYEAFLAYVLEVPYGIALETRSTWIYETHIASTTLARRSPDTDLPSFTLSNRGPVSPIMSTWISTTGTTNPYYRLSAVRARLLEESGILGYIPDIRIINDALEGRLIPSNSNNPPDELTFVIMGDIILPPHPPKRIYAFSLTGEMVLGQYAAWSNGGITETITESGGDNNDSPKVPLDFNDDYYNKYYHCVVYANNNYWGKQNRPTGSIGRLPIFCKYKREPLVYNKLILAPDLGLDDKSLPPEYIEEQIGNTESKTYSINTVRKARREVSIEYWNGGFNCAGHARSSCGKTSRDYDEGSIIELTFVSSDYRDELEWIENKDREDELMVYKVSNPLSVIDAHWLKVKQEQDDSYLSLENYTMPDSPRVKEMHLAIQELADAWSAKEMAYKIDPESGEIPDDPAERARLAGNLGWHLLMLCKWHGIQLLDDKNILHNRGIDRFPIQVVSASGEGTTELQGHYPFGGLAFSNEDEEGKISQIPGYPPSDTTKPQMAYKLKSSKLASDGFGDTKIEEGDYIIVNTIQQLLQVVMQDLDKALGMKDLSAGVVPGVGEGEICTYEGLASAISEVLYMNSAISSQTGQNLISSVITQGIARELLKATGFPLTPKTVEVNVGSTVAVPYPSISDDSPTHYLMFISLLQTLQPIVASVIDKIPTELLQNSRPIL